jgi:hypothetical protein
MLGEIRLDQWRCLAELIDNSVDGFLAGAREGNEVHTPEVHVRVPVTDSPTAQVSVTDNGPGMNAETLERAVRAGWSGNDPIGSLGMFGMGFNIATARLGSVTTVWTTRERDREWVGLQIDFDRFQAQGDFKTPRLTREKVDPAQHGTEIIIERLKPVERQWLTKPANLTKIRNELRRVYASMLRAGGKPVQFRLFVNATLVEGRSHCIWSGPGNNERVVRSPQFGDVDAYQSIDVNLEPRPFCLRCWQWLAATVTTCPTCPEGGRVQKRPRSVRGWLGIQRYLSENDYGIDILRNGRKIEIASKDLFYWTDGEYAKLEYPVDDPRGRGRIVGEIHLDHCRVTYTKDRFDRHDPAWEDMVRIVRGEGPLSPNLAEGFPPNYSPLYRLFQLFRRSTPRSKTSGAWQRLLVVDKNDQAQEMAKYFHAGDPAYQKDDKWWALVLESDRNLLQGAPAPGGGDPAPAPVIPGFGSPASSRLQPPAPAAPVIPGFGPPALSTPPPSPAPLGVPATPVTNPPGPPILALTQLYVIESMNLKWDVRAFPVDETMPELLKGKRAWVFKLQPDGTVLFLVNRRHPVFASATFTPMDALLTQLAYAAMEVFKDTPGDRTFAQFLGELRQRYATETALDATSLSNLARLRLKDIAATLASNISPTDANELFKELAPDVQQRINERMATQAVSNAKAVIAQGRFLEYAPPGVLLDFFGKHPELFVDGKCWDDEYGTLDYGSPSATEIAQQQVVRSYKSLLADAVWLAEQDLRGIEEVSRPRLLRAMHALELLAPSTGDASE